MARDLQPDDLKHILDDIRSQLRALQTSPRLTNASIKDGRLTILDSADAERARFGRLGADYDGDSAEDWGLAVFDGSGSPALLATVAGVRIVGAIEGGTIDIGGSDASSFHVDAAGNLWSGAADFASAPFKVAADGTLTATGATITGDIEVASIDIGGSDASSFHVDTSGNLWLGDASFASAPFKVAADGTLTASGATVTGTIRTAASGRRIEISSADVGVVSFHSGDGSESTEGQIAVVVGGSGGSRTGQVLVSAPDLGGGTATITMASKSPDASSPSQINLFATDILIANSGGTFGVFGGFAAHQTVTGSRGGNAALASLLTALANYGLIIDSTGP